MNDCPSSISRSPDDRLKVLLAEYDAIERMHAHYDILNMSMMAFVTAGVFTIWGLIIQTAFQPHAPVEDPFFVNSVSIFALLLFFGLSVWIRYMTIHRCIIIQKLNRSYEIEKELGMRQNSIFWYDAAKLSAPLDSNIPVRRRPGGHTLELLLYVALSTFGGFTAVVFQWHIRLNWNNWSITLLVLLLISPLLAILWMAFCKLDAMEHIENVEVGFPWNLLFPLIKPINRFFRYLLTQVSHKLIGQIPNYLLCWGHGRDPFHPTRTRGRCPFDHWRSQSPGAG